MKPFILLEDTVSFLTGPDLFQGIFNNQHPFFHDATRADTHRQAPTHTDTSKRVSKPIIMDRRNIVEMSR